ncbi:hypothetical protein LEP3755_52600 [Leptolyngbya sp. NIES-3755]|nr:hypothetical protein LEP3755_52600 [Leptolyngbya sp. NIES-3755]
MIVDIPTGDDFKASGIDLLNLGWGILVDLLQKIEDAQNFYEWNICNESGEDKEDKDEALSQATAKYWEKAQRPLSTALSLIQQGTEFLLKGHIADISPYLLISGEPSSYPKKSHERDIRFSEFKTIDAQDLIRLYNTVSHSSKRLPESFQRKFEDLRSKRNIVMHTVDSNLSLSIKDLFISILEIHHYLSSELWVETRRSFIKNQPMSVMADNLELYEYDKFDRVIYELNLEVSLVMKLLQSSETQKFFKFQKRQRSYICPNCYSEAFEETYVEAGAEMPALAQLFPNEPNSTSVWCAVCNEVSKVAREDCRDTDCLGNVIDESYGICLTCGASID